MGDVIDKPPADYRDYAKVFAAAARAEDLQDYNLVHSGDHNPGRAGKYFSGLIFDPITGSYKTKAQQQAERTVRSLRWLMANDPIYAQAMTSAKQVMVDVLDEAAALIDRLSDAKLLLLDDRSQLRGRAPTLEDGRKVYRDAQGRVRDEEGEVISDALVAHIEWNGNEPSYEEYLALQDQIDTVDATIAQARGVEAEAGRLQGDLTNSDIPPQTANDVRDIEDQGRDLQKRLEEIEILVPAAANESSVKASPSADVSTIATVTIPTTLKRG